MSNPSPIDRSTPNWPDFLWHHRVHEELAGELLYFWRLVFTPTYHRDLVIAGIRAAARRHNIRAVVSYELFGPYDLLLRTWLPQSCHSAEFRETLADELLPASLTWCESFRVRDVIRHWAFAKDETVEPRQPQGYDLHNLQPEEIQDVEAGSASASGDLISRLEDQSLLSRYRPADSPTSHTQPGIKFAVAIASGRSMAGAEGAAFGREVTRVLDEAVNIDQRSLYSGSGFAQFLIMGRAAYDQFHAIHSELTTQLNAAVIRERYESRTMTHISGQRGFSISTDGLSVASDETGRAVVDDPSFVLKLDSRIDLHDMKQGDEVERFRVIQRVDGDRGGFAHVYRVFDKHEKVDRAMKVFKSPDPKAVLRETDALRKVDHTNVVELCLTGNQGDTWFLVTEFVDGQSLVGMGPIDCREALDIAVQILKALEAIHCDGEDIAELNQKKELTQAELEILIEAQESAIVHRDIKPANIMLTPQGTVKVLDFNIASRVQDPQVTKTGTPEYMLPDPGLGKWVPAHDLFGCGVVLYELICGEHPYEHRQPVTHLNARDPRKWRPELSPELVQVLIRACAPMQDALFSTAREMRAVLEVQRAALNGDQSAEVAKIGRTARKLRVATGLTAKKLSEKTGVSEEVLQGFENGTSSLETPQALDILALLSDLLDRGSSDTH